MFQLTVNEQLQATVRKSFVIGQTNSSTKNHLRLPFMLERIKDFEIFAEYKYTLDELVVTKIVFQYV